MIPPRPMPPNGAPPAAAVASPMAPHPAGAGPAAPTGLPPGAVQTKGPGGAPTAGAPPGASPGAPPAPPQPPMQTVFDVNSFMAAIQLLRDERSRGFRIEIEEESTIMADDQARQAEASQFIQSVGAIIQSSLPLVQAQPAMAPIVFGIILFAARQFHIGTELEAKFEDVMEKLEGGQMPPMQNPDDGKNQATAAAQQAKTQGDLAVKQAELQGKMQIQQQDMMQDAQKHQGDMQIEGAKFQAAQVKAAAEMRAAMVKEQAEMASHQRSIEQTHMDQQAAVGQAALAAQKLEFAQGVITDKAKEQ